MCVCVCVCGGGITLKKLAVVPSFTTPYLILDCLVRLSASLNGTLAPSLGLRARNVVVMDMKGSVKSTTSFLFCVMVTGAAARSTVCKATMESEGKANDVLKIRITVFKTTPRTHSLTLNNNNREFSVYPLSYCFQDIV